MEYDEIDEYVNQLFRQNRPEGSQEIIVYNSEDVGQIISDEYNAAILWHNQRISEGCDPRSGLRNLPYVPWDENIDGVAAMHGGGGMWEAPPRQVGKQWTQAEYEAYKRKVAAGFDPYANLRSNAQPRQQESGWGCGEALLIVGAVVAIILFMMVMS